MGARLEPIIKKIKSDKRVAVIVIIGLIGIILLVLSELIPEQGENGTSETDKSETESITEYEESLEKRLSELISEVDGAGKVKVMLTLDCGDENVYATEDKSTETSNEKSYVLIDSNGDDTGLLLKVSQPQVRGVAVVCEGADSSKVRQEITGVLTAVLGVSTNRVNIAKMKNTNGG